MDYIDNKNQSEPLPKGGVATEKNNWGHENSMTIFDTLSSHPKKNPFEFDFKDNGYNDESIF